MGAIRKIFIFLAVVLLLIVALPYLVPLHLFITDGLEQAVSTKLKRRVTIGDVSFSYQPYPTIILENVQFGKAGEDGSAGTIEVQVDLLTAFSDNKRLRKFLINEPSFSQDFLRQVPELLKPETATTTYSTRLITIQKGTIRADKKPYGPLDAEILLNPDQSFQKVVLHDPNHAMEVQISPLKDSYAVSLSAKNWTVPFGAKPMVESMFMDAETRGSSLVAKEIKGSLAFGRFRGTALLDWSNGWVLSGTLNVESMDGDTVSKWFSPRTNITGKLNGDLYITLSSDTVEALVHDPGSHINNAKFDFNSNDGTLYNFDFISPIRANSGGSVTQGGSTRYDSLKGVLVYEGERLTLSGGHLKSGLLTAQGSFSVVKNRLSGSAHVTMGQGPNRRSLPLRMAGELSSPSLIPPVSSSESSVTAITQ